MVEVEAMIQLHHAIVPLFWILFPIKLLGDRCQTYSIIAVSAILSSTPANSLESMPRAKKHEKRLAYLKFCFENGAQSKPLNEMESMPSGAPSIAPVPPPIAPTIPQRTETTSIPPPPPPL